MSGPIGDRWNWSGASSGASLEKFLAGRVVEHQLTTIHCSTCHAVNTEECLPRAAKDGQEPLFAIFYDGADPYNPIHTFGLRPPTAFLSTAKFIPPPELWNSNYANASFSAAIYALHHLKVP